MNAKKSGEQWRKLAGRERRPVSQSFYSPRFGFVDVTSTGIENKGSEDGTPTQLFANNDS